MKKALLFILSFSFLFAEAQLITQQDPLILIVDSNEDLQNARDVMPGDGLCANSAGNCTLRAAVDEANASTGDVRIVLPGTLPGGNNGRYDLNRSPTSEDISLYEDNNEFGDLDLNGSFSSLHIQGTGFPGPEIRVNFSQNERGFHIGDGKSVKMERIYFNQLSSMRGSQGNQDGSGPEGVNGTDGGDGGAIYVGENATFEMDQVTFVQCETGGGGQGVTPSEAAGTTRGGDGGNGGDGGAIYIGSGTQALITRGTFQGCNTGGGGGAGAAGGPDGGNADGGNGGNGGNGGAIYSAGDLTLKSCTLVGNNGGGAGGAGAAKGMGMAGFAGSPAQGGGVAVAQRIPGDTVVMNEGTLTFINCVIAKNEPSGPAQDLYQDTTAATSALISDGYNMIGITKGLGTIFEPQSTDTLGGMSNSLDPQAGGIQNQDTYAVPILEFGANSLAIDAGTTIATDDYDSRGFLRGVDGNQADRGAWEFEAMPIKDSLRISEVDVNTSDGDGEFVEIYNAGKYNLQIDQYFIVAFEGEMGNQCFAADLYGEIEPGGYFVLGDSSVAKLNQAFEYGGNDNACGGGNDQFLNSSGAIGLYEGSARGTDPFQAGTMSMSRRDQVSYDNTAARFNMMFDFCSAFGEEAGCEGSDAGDGESIQIDENGTTSGSPNPGSSGAVVPVEWLNFDVFSKKVGQIDVMWATAWEDQVSGFHVQRFDGREWINEKFISGSDKNKNGASYRVQLQDVAPGLHLLRVKQVDFNGAYSVTDTKSVRVRGNGQITVAPNPVRDRLIISVDVDKHSYDAPYDIFVTNIDGRILQQESLDLSKGNFELDMSQLTNGIYSVIIQGENYFEATRVTKL